MVKCTGFGKKNKYRRNARYGSAMHSYEFNLFCSMHRNCSHESSKEEKEK